MAGKNQLRWLGAILVLGLGMASAAKVAPAATFTWSGSGTDWSTAGNWGGTAPGTADIALFAGASYANQPALGSPAGVGGIWDTGGGAVTVSGSALTINAATINGNANTGIELDGGAGSLAIGAPVVLGAAQTWLNDSGSLLTVSGNIDNGANLLTVGGSGNTTLSGIIGAGTGGLRKLGSGTLTLSRANTYSGGTTINGGAINVGNAWAFGSGILTINASGTAVTGSAFYLNYAHDTWANTNLVVNGNAAMANNITINGANSCGENGLSIGGTGTLTYTGVVTPYNGPMSLKGSATLVLGTGGSISLVGNNGNQILFNDAGTTLVLNGGAFSATGNNGTSSAWLGNLIMNSGAASMGGPLSTQVSLVAGASLSLNGGVYSVQGFSGNASNTVNFNGGTLQALASTSAANFLPSPIVVKVQTGGVVIDTNGRDIAISAALTHDAALGATPDGGLTKNGLGALTLSGNNSTTGTATIAAGILQVGSIAALPSNIVVQGAGVLAATGAYTTATDWLNSGKISTISAGALALTGSTSESINLTTTGGAYTSLSLGAVVNVAYTGTLAPAGGNYRLGGGGGALTMSDGALSGGNNLVVGAGGGGTVVLLGSNSYTGSTTLMAGTLNIGSDAALGSTTAALNFSGAAILQAAGTLTSPRNVSLASGAIATVDDQGNAVSLSGQITGSGGLAKLGSGTLTLPRGNSYSGGTTINGGTVNVGNAWAFGTGILTLNGSGTAVTGSAFYLSASPYPWTNADLVVNGHAAVSNSITIANGNSSNGLVVGGTGTLTYSGVVAPYGGPMNLLGTATLVLGTGGSISLTGINGNQLLFGSAGSTLILNGGAFSSTGNNVTDAGRIGNLIMNSGAASMGGAGSTQVLIQPGATVSLNGGTYSMQGFSGNASNTVNFNGGTLQALALTLTSATNFVPSAIVTRVQAGGATIDTNGRTITISAALAHDAALGATPDGGLTKIGSGTLVLAGINSYTGGTLASSGALAFSGAGSIPSGTRITVATGSYVQADSAALGGAGGFAGFLSMFDSANCQGVVGLASDVSTAIDLTGFGAAARLGTLGTATISGPIAPQGGDYQFGGGGGTLTVGSQLTGTYSLNMGTSGNLPAGIVVLTNTNNSYSGGTTLAAGVLSISDDNNLGGAVTTITFAGGALGITGTSLTNLDNHAVNWNSFNGGFDIAAGGNAFTVTQTLSGSGGLTKLGAGTLRLSGSNSYSGGTVINNGTLDVGNAWAFGTGILTINASGTVITGGAFNLNSSYYSWVMGNPDLVVGGNAALANNITLSGPVGGGTYGLAIGGTGTLTYSGVLTPYNGPLSLLGSATLVLGTGGSIALTGNMGNQILLGSAGSTLVLNGGAFSATGNNANNAGYIGNLIMNAGTASMGGPSSVQVALLPGGTVSLSGGICAVQGFAGDASNTVKFNGGTLQALALSSTSAASFLPSPIVAKVQSGGAVIDTNGRDITISAALTHDAALAATPDGGLTKTGSGTLVLSASNGYTGGTTVSGGALQMSNASALGNAASAPLTLSGGTLDLCGYSLAVGTLAGTSGAITSGTGSATLTTTVAAGTSTYGGAISAAIGLIKSGGGTLNLGGSNTYSGGTIVSAGTLQLGNTNALGPSTNSLALDGGTLDLNGLSPAIGLLSGSGTITSSAGSAALYTSFSGTFTFAGTLSNPARLVLQGSGTLVLTGSADGPVTVSGGILQVGTGGALGDISGDIITGAAVVFKRSDTYYYAGQITGTGTLTQAGSGILVLSNTGNAQGNTAIAAGELSVSSNSNLGPGISFSSGLLRITGMAMTILDGHPAINWDTFNGGFDIAAGGNQFTVTGAPGGAGSLTKTGSGTLVLANVSAAYLGGTTVQAGALQVGDGASANGSLGGGDSVSGNVNLSAGTTLRFANPFDQLYNGVISGSGTVIKTSNGTLVMGGSNTFTGGLTVNSGTLQLADTNALGPSGATVTVSGGALDLGGVNPAVGALNSSPGATIALGAATLAVGDGDANSTLAGTITGTGGGLAIHGTGTMVLGGSNSFSGTTSFTSVGRLTLANGQALSMSTVDFANGGGSLNFGSLTAITLGGLAGTNYHDSNFDNRLALVNAGGTAVTLSVGNNGQDTSFTGDILGSGSLIKIGTGTLTLSGTDAYTGGTTVLGGALDIESVSALPGNSTLAIANTAEVIFATDLGSAIQLSLMLPGAGGGGAPGLMYFHVTSSVPASVPEPGTLALLAAALLAGVAAWLRRRSRI
jgi:fibronectin-binding autotransporter adhesin